MKKIKKWFSFIELIVVISIMAIVMWAWIAYFGDFVDSMKYKNELEKLKDNIRILENQVLEKEIFDYEVIFEKDKNYYLINENKAGNDINLKLNSIDSNSWIWTFSFSWVSSGTWIIKYYKWYKFKKALSIPYNWTFTWSFLENDNYKIVASFSGVMINTIYLKDYFSNDELDWDIKYIWTDKTINNILWKKNYNDLELEFETDLWKKEKLIIN